jgi:prepilin signal peptidase PulO-like enzyme (type II secretory pathway)
MSIETAIVLTVCTISAISDLKTGYIFDAVVLPGSAALVILAVLHGTLASYAAGTAVAAGIPLALYLLTRGAGIGFGDVKLGCCIGALGALPSLRVLEDAFIAGGCIAVILLLLRGRMARGLQIPFAPFLLSGVLATLLLPGGAS